MDRKRFFILAVCGLILCFSLVVNAQEKPEKREDAGIVFKNYRVKGLDLSKVEERTVLQERLDKAMSKQGKCYMDVENNSIFVQDSRQNHEEVAKVLEEIAKEFTEMEATATAATQEDGAVAEEPGAIKVKRFRLANRSAAELEAIIELYLSKDVEEAAVTIDERTNSIVVSDTVAKLQQIEAVISEFDSQLKTVTLSVRFIISCDKAEKEEGVSDVGEELKKVFLGHNFRVVDNLLITATEGSPLSHRDTLSEVTVEVESVSVLSAAAGQKIRLESFCFSKDLTSIEELGIKSSSLYEVENSITLTNGVPKVLASTTVKGTKKVVAILLKATAN